MNKTNKSTVKTANASQDRAFKNWLDPLGGRQDNIQHTSGPWFVYEPEWNEGPTTGRCDNILIGKKHRNDIPQEIARVNCDSSFFNETDDLVRVKSSLVRDAVAPREAVANARLIAAAPRTLEELKNLVGIICSLPGYEERDVNIEDCDSAKAVIAKIEGN